MATAGKSIIIGGASGYWGESDMATGQLLTAPRLDYLVYDYLAEVTLAIMARARAKNPEMGYATDFVSAVLAPHLKAIAGRGIKVLSNAGGVNPEACGRAVEALIEKLELALKVAVVTGDDLLAERHSLAAAGHRDMFSGADFPAPDDILSINAYLGAFPIAAALDAGADIVITGRSVDSATTLGACIHAFGWDRKDWDHLAAGSLAGHIVECGPQATGGNHTDWTDIAESLDRVGYPLAEVSADGAFICSKPEDSGGTVTVGTVGEQMLYEIGDPAAYILPDVICDFTAVTLEQVQPGRVRVSGAKGRPAPGDYKVALTAHEGWRAGSVMFYTGEDAAARARSFADSALARARAKLRRANAPDFDDVSVEITGDESEYGSFARPQAAASRSVAVKIAVRHSDERGAGLLLREISGLGLGAPAGLSVFVGSRPKPSPVVRLFSFLLDKKALTPVLRLYGRSIPLAAEPVATAPAAPPAIAPPERPASAGPLVEVPLARLAFARSGDKGDKANIGVLPRRIAYAPWIWAALTPEAVAARFAHFMAGGAEDVLRYYLPGTGAVNLLIDRVLGGGGTASIRSDPQGKSYSQLVLAMPIAIPESLLESLAA